MEPTPFHPFTMQQNTKRHLKLAYSTGEKILNGHSHDMCMLETHQFNNIFVRHPINLLYFKHNGFWRNDMRGQNDFSACRYTGGIPQ